jgi:mono/diheme cytochrome c family protein
MSRIRKGRSTSRTSGRDKAKGRFGLAAVTLIAAGLVLMALLVACGSGSSEPTQAPSSATVSPAEMPAQDGATLLEARCSICHSADRAKQVKKTRDEWDQTVTRMIDRGAQLTEAEKAALVDYLASTYGP